MRYRHEIFDEIIRKISKLDIYYIEYQKITHHLKTKPMTQTLQKCELRWLEHVQRIGEKKSTQKIREARPPKKKKRKSLNKI